MNEIINYTCNQCGRSGCKLWRKYQTFLEYQTLLCAKCVTNKMGIDLKTVGPDGRRTTDYGPDGHKTDQMGSFVPGVLTPCKTMFWGYTSVPIEDVEKWQVLPL